MRFAPKLSVGARLILAMILVVVVSGGLGALLGYQAMRLNLLRPARRAGPPSARRGDRPPPPVENRELAPPGESGPGMGPRPGPRRPPPFVNPMFLINLGVGLVVALAAGLWLSRRFTRPLALLAEGASALRSGNLGHRVPMAGDDEFGRVAISMNQMAERIADQVEALQADGRRRQQLLADVAHELRSPVAALKAMAEALRDGIAASPERSERATRAIVDSAARLERLVTDLMDLARLDLEEFPLHPVPLDLRAAARDCVRRHHQAAEKAGLLLHPIEEGDRVPVSADPHRLAQVLDNLVDNAISHGGPGTEIRVTLTLGQHATLTVSDTGRGISAEHLPYLFDPFYRGDAARTPGDRHSGLGLRIARGLAQAHGGDLRIESVEGRGTRAVLSLPVFPGPA
jgi:two-component system sensor histidine kinase BaeS